MQHCDNVDSSINRPYLIGHSKFAARLKFHSELKQSIVPNCVSTESRGKCLIFTAMLIVRYCELVFIIRNPITRLAALIGSSQTSSLFNGNSILLQSLASFIDAYIIQDFIVYRYRFNKCNMQV